MSEEINLRKIGDFLWEIEPEGDMRVPARIYSDRDAIDFLLNESRTRQWDALRQIRNVASLPGLQIAALGMADIHPGYGFPIGGVGAFDQDEGIVTLAGVGFDINCGVRSMAVDLSMDEIESNKEKLAEQLFRTVPAGLGSTGKLKLSVEEIDRVLTEGARFAVRRGYGTDQDLEYIEEKGKMNGADPSAVSEQAKRRQLKQVGTLGSGNHYLEVQYVDRVYFSEAAESYGLEEGSVVVSIHTGSRALGHQIGTDYQSILRRASRKYGLPIYEKELVGAPIKSPEGKRYISAVIAGINCAFANRQVIAGLVRKAFNGVFATSENDIRTVYEVGHNNIKFEKHTVEGIEKELLVHRKGATRAFGPGRDEVPARYRAVGHPVLVGGTMGTSSYILAGTEKGMGETFGSAVHGAGRLKSRKQARKDVWGEDLINELKEEGILVRVHSKAGAAEEAPGAYKDVDRVVRAMEGAGVNRLVVRLKPVICIKG
ncbi:MAG: RNA-splicing ligase RtcB [Candidatus Latescibacteria bacterium]|nr:RNA-splicing ligase RtcB [bacterium]MBD3425376.1 RNA-splicing ligase RtcB [Candidatus Latescibacterota bacterium]